MAAKSTRRPASSSESAFGLNLHGWLRTASDAKAKASVGKPKGRAIFIGQGHLLEAALHELDLSLPPWLLDRASKKRGEVVYGATEAGPLWVLAADAKAAAVAHGGVFQLSPYSVARDLAAQLVPLLIDFPISELEWQTYGATGDEQVGAMLGLELGAYRFKQARQPQAALELPRLNLRGTNAALIARAARLGSATNLARHLVNLPSADLDPTTYGAGVVSLFSTFPAFKTEVWRGKKLVQERMNLLLAVGQAATEPPVLVHLKYRPKKAPRHAKPLAFVGKGITFDSGGLDLKTGAGMRYMKKDMGGSASLVGLAYWLAVSELPVACDFYLALAENAIDQRSFHPGDIITARSGLSVEIDNTDAEGRLVLADALDVAINADEKPALVIDLATLTGAMRVALGLRVAGLFANDDGLADALMAASQRSGDPTWRMPLFGDYLSSLKSVGADLANSGGSPYGGGITAALFLQRFVGQMPWAHVDMNAWTEGNSGGCLEAGGNGQWVQLLAEFLTERSSG